jgi:argininosuccinate synthase
MLELKAHKSLETLTLTKDVAHFKPVIEKQFAEQTYNGLQHLAFHILHVILYQLNDSLRDRYVRYHVYQLNQDTPDEIILSFKNGVPVQLNHKDYDLDQLILTLND